MYAYMHTEGIKKGVLARRKADSKSHHEPVSPELAHTHVWRAPRQCCAVVWHPEIDALYVGGMLLCVHIYVLVRTCTCVCS